MAKLGWIVWQAALGLFLLPPAYAAEDWPRWRGPRGDSTWQAPAIPEQWPGGGPRVVWRAPLGPGYSGIAVAGGRVYTLDRPPDSDSERVVCFDQASGRLVWEHRYPADYGNLDYGKGPRSMPTVYEGRVYTLGAVGHFYCLDAATGAVQWRKDFVRDEHAKIPEWGFAASGVIDGDNVIVHAGLPRGGCYVAYDRLTGAERWRGGDDPLGYATPVVAEHAGVRQLIGWTPEHIVSLRTDDGQLLWKQPYKVTYGVSIATPLVQDGVVLVCGYWEGSKAIQLGSQPEEARLLWEENRYLRGLMAPPLYRDGHVYLLDKQHGIVAFRLADGEKLWTDGNRLTPRGRNPQVSLVWLDAPGSSKVSSRALRAETAAASSAGDSHRAIALNSEGELILLRLSPAGLTESSRAKVVGPTWAHPAYAGSYCFARDDEQVVCLQLADEE